MSDSDWKEAVDKELQHARIARNNGNEGMARVCARRAAGIAIAEYLQRNRLPDPGPSAINRLNYIGTRENLPRTVRQAVKHLTQRVDPNFELPIETDLISEAHRLIEALLPEFQDPED